MEPGVTPSSAMLLSIFLVHFLLWLPVDGRPPVGGWQEEVKALKTLTSNWTSSKRSFDGWDHFGKSDYCVWHHITCNRNGYVIRIDLGNAGISGVLVKELCDFKHLGILTLYQNQLRSFIPKELSCLGRLKSLDLSSNFLVGNVPDSWSKFGEDRFFKNWGLCGKTVNRPECCDKSDQKCRGQGFDTCCDQFENNCCRKNKSCCKLRSRRRLNATSYGV